MNYDAVIFDFDGTLADTGPDVWLSIEFAAREAGGRIREDFVAKAANLGLSIEEIFAAIEPFPGAEKLERFADDVARHYRTINRYELTEFYPGIPGLLESLKGAGVPAYIVTLKPYEALSRILELKRWNSFFVAWYSPDSLPGPARSKASLIAYLLAGRLKGFNPVYVGDTWSDVAAARTCGIDCVGAAYGDGDVAALLAECPRHVVYNSRQLANYV
jgi:phosphoglycolate phosphatase